MTEQRYDTDIVIDEDEVRTYPWLSPDVVHAATGRQLRSKEFSGWPKIAEWMFSSKTPPREPNVVE